MGRHKMPLEQKKIKNAAEARAYYLAHREEQIERNRVYRSKHKERLYLHARHRLIKKRYGLGIERAVEMWESQGKACAICRTEIISPALVVKTVKNKPHIDHCHKTGKTRGILCAPCNLALGLWDDDTNRMHRAITYLRSFS